MGPWASLSRVLEHCPSMKMRCIIPFLIWSLGLEPCGSPSQLVPFPQLWSNSYLLGLMERPVQVVGLAPGEEQLFTSGSFLSHPISFLFWVSLNLGEEGCGSKGREGGEERQVVILFPPSPAEKWLPSALSALDIGCRDLIKL